MRFAGASPNHSATWACAFGVSIQFIHLSMQLGCWALEDSIQVSDQPVAPSLGSTVLIGCLSAASRLAVYCQIDPTYEVALREALLLLGESAQYWPIERPLLLQQRDGRVELLLRRARTGS